MSRNLTLFIVSFVALFNAATAGAQTQSLALDSQTWRIAAQKAEVTEHLGRQAIALTGGRVWADDVQFGDGVIRFDVAYKEQTVFIGAGWRAEDDSHFEEMYFRGHLNNKPDALQYTPVVNRLSAWQIFSDENSIAPVSQNFTSWNEVKIVVQGDRADIYFNSLTPVLHIPDLKTALKSGAVSLRSSGQAAGPVYFSKITMRPLQAGEGIVGQPKAMPALPAGLIKQWLVSTPFPEEKIAEKLSVNNSDVGTRTWRTLATESNGIANLARFANPRVNGNTVFVRLNIVSDKSRMKELRFGYSDRARIYLNGKRVFSGNSGWRVRDYRFLGTVGFFDSVGLDLRAGNNEILIAVSETFGGWAWAGAIDDREGVTMQ